MGIGAPRRNSLCKEEAMTLGPVGQKIAAKLTHDFAPTSLEVIDESHQHEGHAGARPDGESHFRVKIAAAAFRGLSRVEQHRRINASLADLLGSRVHALAIQSAAAPDFSFCELRSDDPSLRSLVKGAGLPADDFGAAGQFFIGIRDDTGQLVAAGGLEDAGPHALLRSVAVDPAWRGKRLGQTVVLKLLATARNAGKTSVYLLTTSASDFFAGLGFEAMARDRVPPEIAALAQFTGRQCAAAHAMRATITS